GLAPVRGEPLAVPRVESVAERVADDLVGHHPGVPRLGQAEQARAAPRGLVDALHARKDARPGPVTGYRSAGPAYAGGGWSLARTALASGWSRSSRMARASRQADRAPAGFAAARWVSPRRISRLASSYRSPRRRYRSRACR